MNKTNIKQVRQKYRPKFKDQAFERAAKDGVSGVSKDLGIAKSMLYYWHSQKNKSVQQLKPKNYSKRKWRTLNVKMSVFKRKTLT